MMSDMKCPFCNKPLQPTLRQSDEYWCENYDCPRTNIEWVGSQKLWQELIKTKQALDIAVDALKENLSQANFTQMLDASRFHVIRTKCEYALDQIKQITETKEEK